MRKGKVKTTSFALAKHEIWPYYHSNAIGSKGTGVATGHQQGEKAYLTNMDLKIMDLLEEAHESLKHVTSCYQ